MKGLILLLKTVALIPILFFGCNEEEQTSIVAEYFIVNEEGIKTNSLKKGENFAFRLVFENKSYSDVHFNKMKPFNEFCKLYRINEGVKTLVGQPFKTMFCEYKGVFAVIPPGEKFILEVPWSNDQSSTLKRSTIVCGESETELGSLIPGNYQSDFTSTFYFNDDEYLFEKHFTINFIINE
ncbi:MAG: hypothetical protein HC831_01730 [Chloroflexia bacterium]|nr:hypothetical protein [Chloroflexia bacterium]